MTDGADQGSGQSVMDRLTAHMTNLTGLSNEAPEEAAPQEAAPEESPSLEEIEWEGEKFQIHPKLKDALMKNADYTQKTQALAEQRKQIDHIQELSKQAQMERAFTESVKAEQQELAVIEAYLQQVQKQNWANMKTEDVLRAKIEIDNIKDRRADLQRSIQDKRGTFDKDVKAKLAEMRARSRELASKRITGFSDDTEKAVRDFAVREGLTEAEFENVSLDPRSYSILWKASQFEKVAANASKAAETAQKALKPTGASERMPQSKVAELNFRKAQKAAKSSGEKARNIESYLANRFGG